METSPTSLSAARSLLLEFLQAHRDGTSLTPAERGVIQALDAWMSEQLERRETPSIAVSKELRDLRALVILVLRP